MPSATTSNFLHDKFLNFLFRSGADGVWDNKPANFYIALFKVTIPNPANEGGTEISSSGTGYARVLIEADPNKWDGPNAGTSGRELSNKEDIVFGVPSADWGTIVGAGIYDAASGGNLYYTATLTTQKTVSNGDGAPKILAGQLKISRASC